MGATFDRKEEENNIRMNIRGNSLENFPSINSNLI